MRGYYISGMNGPMSRDFAGCEDLECKSGDFGVSGSMTGYIRAYRGIVLG